MNTVFYQQLSVLLSVAAFTVLGGGLSAQAETIPVPGTTATSAAVTQAESLTSQIPEPAAEAGDLEGEHVSFAE